MPRRKASPISVFFAPPQRKRLPFQGSWLGAAETERLYQICSCRVPPAAPSFLSQEKRWGRKECVGTRLVLSASKFRRGPMFQASFHSIVTSRASWYAPPDTWGHQVCN